MTDKESINWRDQVADDDATAVDEALQQLIRALNRLMPRGTTADPMVEAAATRWCISQLEAWQSGELRGEFQLVEEGDERFFEEGGEG